MFKTTAIVSVQIKRQAVDIQRRYFGKGIHSVAVDEAHCLISSVFKQLNVSKKDSATMADAILEADKRGHYSQGIRMLPKYVCGLKNCTIEPDAKPEVLNETPATAWISGNNGLGPVVGKYSMKEAIKKAKNCGAGLVSTKNSNHFGIASYYCLMAMEKCMIGSAMTNGPPVLVPPGALCRALGYNPLSVGAQVSPRDRFLWDMASTQVTLGKIAECARNKKKIPMNWALDCKNKKTCDPNEALKAEKLQPFGDFKGYGIATMVEILTGVLSDANYGPKFSAQNASSMECQNIGHAFLVIDPKRFAPEFEKRLCDFMKILRTLPCGQCAVMIPGDIEEQHSCESNNCGIPYTCEEIKIYNDLAADYCLPAIGTL